MGSGLAKSVAIDALPFGQHILRWKTPGTNGPGRVNAPRKIWGEKGVWVKLRTGEIAVRVIFHRVLKPRQTVVVRSMHWSVWHRRAADTRSIQTASEIGVRFIFQRVPERAVQNGPPSDFPINFADPVNAEDFEEILHSRDRMPKLPQSLETVFRSVFPRLPATSFCG
jgi:hypothetical protein